MNPHHPKVITYFTPYPPHPCMQWCAVFYERTVVTTGDEKAIVRHGSNGMRCYGATEDEAEQALTAWWTEMHEREAAKAERAEAARERARKAKAA